jgi:hypothetical protein
LKKFLRSPTLALKGKDTEGRKPEKGGRGGLERGGGREGAVRRKEGRDLSPLSTQNYAPVTMSTITSVKKCDRNLV